MLSAVEVAVKKWTLAWLVATGLVMTVACSSGDVATADGHCPKVSDPVRAIYQAVDPAHLQQYLRAGSGVDPLTLDGGTARIQNRFSPQAKTMFRAYFTQHMQALGLDVHEMPYTTRHSIGETEGHNVEAILPGTSTDSVVVIVHYDSIGPVGSESSNPGADDDMTGMATMMEAARVLSASCVTRAKTIRFVAADYEEQGNPGLEGARAYAAAIKQLAASQHFSIVAAFDYEQSGWNCASDNLCDPDAGGRNFDVDDCSGDSHNYKSTPLGDALEQLVGTLGSPLRVVRGCLADISDHYAMWEIGVPAVVTCEHAPRTNPHFDNKGGDTYARVDTTYHAEIARVSIAFTAQLAGVVAVGVPTGTSVSPLR
jgi:hypothetical protein